MLSKLTDQYFQGATATIKLGEPKGRCGNTRILGSTGGCSETDVGGAKRNSQVTHSWLPASSLQTSEMTMPCPPGRPRSHGLRFSQCLVVSALLLWPGHPSLSGFFRPWHSVVPPARNVLDLPSPAWNMQHFSLGAGSKWGLVSMQQVLSKCRKLNYLESSQSLQCQLDPAWLVSITALSSPTAPLPPPPPILASWPPHCSFCPTALHWLLLLSKCFSWPHQLSASHEDFPGPPCHMSPLPPCPGDFCSSQCQPTAFSISPMSLGSLWAGLSSLCQAHSRCSINACGMNGQ